LFDHEIHVGGPGGAIETCVGGIVVVLNGGIVTASEGGGFTDVDIAVDVFVIVVVE